MTVLLAFWLGFAVTLVYPLRRHQFPGHWIGYALAPVFAALWPVWAFCLLRKAFLRALLNG